MPVVTVVSLYIPMVLHECTCVGAISSTLSCLHSSGSVAKAVVDVLFGSQGPPGSIKKELDLSF